MKVAGVILAGGRASRMGGTDKSTLLLGGRPLLAHAIGRLRDQVDRLAVNSNAAPETLPLTDLPVIADETDARPGPLGGVLAGMNWAATEGATHVVTVPVDTPFLPADLVERLVAGSEKVPVMAASNGATHPVVALWPVQLRASLADFLVADEKRKVSVFAAAHGALTAGFPMIELGGGEVLDPFFNVNTPEDLAVAEAMLSRLST